MYHLTCIISFLGNMTDLELKLWKFKGVGEMGDQWSLEVRKDILGTMQIIIIIIK